MRLVIAAAVIAVVIGVGLLIAAAMYGALSDTKWSQVDDCRSSSATCDGAINNAKDADAAAGATGGLGAVFTAGGIALMAAVGWRQGRSADTATN